MEFPLSTIACKNSRRRNWSDSGGGNKKMDINVPQHKIKYDKRVGKQTEVSHLLITFIYNKPPAIKYFGHIARREIDSLQKIDQLWNSIRNKSKRTTQQTGGRG